VAVRRRPAREAPGQHFLRSSRLAADLVAEARVARGDLVVEVGGGTGVLTHALARTGADVVVIERDTALTAQLLARFGQIGNVETVLADATEYVWPAREFVLVANLPFARSGAILNHLLRDPNTPLQRLLVIVQWEFAAKHTAIWPATLRSTYWRAWYDVTTKGKLARTAFSPPPSVDAAILSIERRNQPRVPADAHQAYWRFLSTAFTSQQPIRRTRLPGLPPLQVKRLTPALGFAPDAYARDLDARQWAGLFAAARPVPGSTPPP